MRVCVCVSGGSYVGRGGMCLMENQEGREVHEWPVLAHFRLSVFASQYSMPLCPSTMTPGEVFRETTQVKYWIYHFLIRLPTFVFCV